MTADAPLQAHLTVLVHALEAYLLRLRTLWAAPVQDAVLAEVGRVVAGVGARPAPTPEGAERVRALLEASPAAVPSGLAGIAAGLGLSSGEEALAAAAFWSEADPQLAVVLGCAHDDASRRYASAALLRLVLAPYGLEPPPAVDDLGPLVTHGVLEPGAGATGALRLTATARLLLTGGRPAPIPSGRPAPARLGSAVAALARHLESGAGGIVVLRGPSGIGRAAVAAQAAERAGFVPVGADRPPAELRLLAGLGIALPVVRADALPEIGWRGDDGPLVALAAPGETVPGSYVVDLPGPGYEERELLWREGLAACSIDDAHGLAPALATRFAFTERDVEETLARARTAAHWRDRPLDGIGVWDAARRQPEHALERLAALVTPTFTLADLILPDEAVAQLCELVAHVDLQHVVLDSWGFRRRLPRGQGVIALFAGPPGTGKTMAAEAVADGLRQDLYRVDLSAVVSKYVGETEKNLASAFDEAERASAVLFFDEADSLFGQRTEVRDAHDRYANLEVNYLLQRVETFTGLVLLATNRQAALDEAFVRRLRFVVRFELPDASLRAALWRRSFPPETAVDLLDWQELAEAELSGGSIQSAALAAAYLAAANGGRVARAHVEHALRREHDKLGKAWAGLPGEAGA